MVPAKLSFSGPHEPFYLDILIVEGKLLGFDFLLGFDAIKKLGAMHLRESSAVRFLAENLPRCAAIKIDEPDISAVFDH